MGNRRATYDDLRRLPDHVVGEIVAGQLYASPRPALRHAHASSAMGMALGAPFHFGSSGPGGWWIIDEPELHLGADVVVPDLAGWRRTRMPRLPEGHAVELPPDWLCEVLSPSTMQLDRTRKLPVYARAGVPHVWLVDPLARTLEVFRLEEHGYVVIASHYEAARVRAEPFDAVELDLGLWWLPGEEPTTTPLP